MSLFRYAGSFSAKTFGLVLLGVLAAWAQSSTEKPSSRPQPVATPTPSAAPSPAKKARPRPRPGAAHAPAFPHAPAAKLTTLTPKPGFFNEPSIAVNPKNPDQLVAGYQVNASVAYSTDGGKKWTKAKNSAPKNFKISGDVSVAYGLDGAAYLCYIAFDKLGTAYYWGHNATRNGIFVRRSADGGKTWGAPRAVIEHATKPGIPFEDKPYLVSDTTDGPNAGNLYLGWTEFTLEKSVILFSRSTDSGATWSAPIEISTHEGLPRDDNGSVEGFAGAVAPDGTLYVVWADGNNIAFTFSHNGGKTFAHSRNIVEIGPPYFQVAGIERSSGFPQIGLDQASGLLYVTWSDYRNGDVDIFAATSADHGETWSEPVRVNSDTVHNGRDQFLQWLAVDPKTGAANVIFYDRRHDPKNSRTTVTLARSTDGGKTFANYAWSDVPFEGNKDFIGDYTGIAAWDGRVYGIWAEEVARKEKTVAPAAGGRGRKPHTVVRVGVAEFGKTAASH
jgi:hypothetical protein